MRGMYVPGYAPFYTIWYHIFFLFTTSVQLNVPHWVSEPGNEIGKWDCLPIDNQIATSLVTIRYMPLIRIPLSPNCNLHIRTLEKFMGLLQCLPGRHQVPLEDFLRYSSSHYIYSHYKINDLSPHFFPRLFHAIFKPTKKLYIFFIFRIIWSEYILIFILFSLLKIFINLKTWRKIFYIFWREKNFKN